MSSLRIKPKDTVCFRVPSSCIVSTVPLYAYTQFKRLLGARLGESQSELYSAGPKHSARFGCNSHIGQLNATTSALSPPFAYSIHMLMMSLVFSSACVYFLSPCTSSPPPSLFVSPDKKRCRTFGFILPFFRKRQRYSRPIFTSSPLKGRLDECHSCCVAVPLISTRSPFNGREGKALALPQAA